MTYLRVAIAQVNPTVGDLDGNVALVLDAIADAETHDADVVVFPEMVLTGYPPEDLVLKAGFVAASRAALDKVAAATRRCVAVVGFADGAATAAREVPDVAGFDFANGVWNAVAVCSHGQVVGTYHKRHLPNYDVFDEQRQFRAGTGPHTLFDIAGVPVGVTVCEDAWVPDGPVTQLARGGARLVLNVNGSPFREGKVDVREQTIVRRVEESGVAVVYVNLVGGQDELVFDGGSFVIDHRGAVVARCAQFESVVDVVDVEVPEVAEPLVHYPRLQASAPPDTEALTPSEPVRAPVLGELEQRWKALALATRDYVHKSGFSDVAIGLSGGIDSSLVAAIAADALGADHVHGVLMPSRYSSDHSISDAEELAANLGIEARTIPIEPAHAAFLDMLAVSFGDREPGLTEENIQSRIRGVVLMALANASGWLVLTTGNKSEASVGYSTLYGDTAGAYSVIKDVWKLSVYELCAWRNQTEGRVVIPENVISKAPSAELRPDQRDDQTLPPYEILDPILKVYVEGDLTVAEVIDLDLAPAEVVRRVCRLVDTAEFKRRQTPVGARITTKGFGRDRRLPIVNRYRG